MRVANRLSLLLAAAGTQVVATEPVTGKLGNATVVTNNPQGVVYKATLPDTAFFKDAYPNGGNIKGEISAVASSDGKGVVFAVKLSNLPKTGGPFSYHLHVDPVPQDGNCTATGGHLDPFERGSKPACDSALPETCQVGDLSGKHGTIPANQDSFETTYTDLYASTLGGISAFFGNRSIVIHDNNGTRITCASFEKAEGGMPGWQSPSSSLSASLAEPTPTGCEPTYPGSANASGTSNPPGAATPSSPLTIGDASKVRAGLASAVVFGAAVLFML